MNILVNLVSDQTIPNVLVTYSIRERFSIDRLFFISTNYMNKKNKVKHIVNTLSELGINVDYEILTLTNEYSLYDIYKDLSYLSERYKNAQFFVNLTCGTKIMFFVTHEFFKSLGSKFFYLPEWKKNSIINLSVFDADEEIPINLKLSAKNYLSGYGITLENYNSLPNYINRALERKNITLKLYNNYPQTKQMLSELFEQIKTNGYKIKQKKILLTFELSNLNDIQKSILKSYGFTIKGSSVSASLDKYDIEYLTGGWFEEYVFITLYEMKNEGIIDDVVLKMQTLVSNLAVHNELDVAFTKDNKLFIVECKSLDPDDEINKNALYKIQSFKDRTNIGANVKGFYVTTSSAIFDNHSNDVKLHLKNRAKLYNTEIIHLDGSKNLKEIILPYIN